MIIYFFLFYINESLKQESIVTLSLYLCLASDEVHSELFVTAAVKQRIKLLKETWLLKSIIIKSKNTPFVKFYVKVPSKYQHLSCYY
jgi:hypothetical protein